jgi:aminomethyltransferase
MKRTPLYEVHRKAGAKMVEFAGWEMPLHYPPGILAEHLATRKFGGLFDISHMGRFRLSGPDALPFMQHVLTNNAAALEPGQSQYTIIPNESGGAIDDSYLYRLDEEAYILVVNAANAERDWDWLQKYSREFPRLALEDDTAKTAMLSLQGPRAKTVLEAIVSERAKLPEPLRNRLTIAEIFGTEVAMARTGYTGEPICFELLAPAESTERLWTELLKIGEPEGIAPVGLGARDTLRLEAGLPLYGHELGVDAEGKEIPVLALSAARLAVSFAGIKGDFVGRQALTPQFQEIKLREEGLLATPREQWRVPRTIFPLAISDQGVARAGYPVSVDDRPVGYVTSGTVVPYWKSEGDGVAAGPGAETEKRALCLAYLDADLTEGQRVTVMIRDRTAQAIIVERHIGGEAPPYARPLLAEAADDPSAQDPPGNMAKLAEALVRKARDNTLWRQQSTINLIPSEQTVSPLVKLLSIADPSGRYAEHRRVEALGDVEAYFYQGTGFIAEIEQELGETIKQFFGCAEVETRMISGQMANATVFSGLMDYLNRVDRRSSPRRLRCVMNHHIGRGGHLSAQPMGALRDYVAKHPITERWAVVNFPVLAENPYRMDLARTAELIAEHKPELLILGKSMILHPEPIEELAQMITHLRPKPILMYDAAHVLGLLGPCFQQPFAQGADIVTGSTHKTFFGTQRGIIASNMSRGTAYDDLWQSIIKRAFPGAVSNHHLGTLLGLLMAALEMNAYGRDALALKEQGLPVEGDPEVNYTETHQVVLRVGYARGIEVAQRLEKNNIIVNYQALPDDEGFTASSGLRTGVQEMTRFGMKETDFAELAGYMAAAILQEKDVAADVARFRRKFLEMRYCLPAAEAKPLIEDLITILLKS